MRMTLPRINIKATNVELNTSLRGLINRRLAPLSKMLQQESEVILNVVLRRTHSRVTGDMFFVSVKAVTSEDSYMAVSAKHHLSRALTSVRETLRQSISRGESVSDYSIRKSRQEKVQAFTLTL